MATATATLEQQPGITGGVDAHKNTPTHHAVALDYRGVRLGDREFEDNCNGLPMPT